MDGDFIEEFVSATDTGLAPENFRRWAGIVAVGAALDRNVWTVLRKGRKLWPNMFVMLVGPPGVGKSEAIDPARELLITQEQVHLSPDSITHEDFIKTLGERNIGIGSDGMPRQKSTMSLFLSEWGTFLRRPNNDTLSMLAAVYDSKDYAASTIGRGLDNASNLYINVLAGCTPAWFADGFPPNSYEQGLPTRFIFVFEDYQSEADKPDFDFDASADVSIEAVVERLYPTLDKIATQEGLCAWTPKAASILNDWKADNFEPAPRAPILAGYCARRPLHVGKLATILAASTHPEHLSIQREDAERALDILTATEANMERALSAAGGNEYQLRMEQIYGYVCARFRETKKAVAEWEVRQRLAKLVPPNIASIIIDEMINSKTIKTVPGSKAPNRKLKPGVIK